MRTQPLYRGKKDVCIIKDIIYNDRILAERKLKLSMGL